MFLAAELSCNMDYTYFTPLTCKYYPAHFLFNTVFLVASRENPSFRNASVTVHLKLKDRQLCYSAVLLGYGDGRDMGHKNKQILRHITSSSMHQPVLQVPSLPCNWHQAMEGDPAKAAHIITLLPLLHRYTILLTCEVILKQYQNSTAKFSFGKTFLSLRHEIQAKCNHAASYQRLSVNGGTTYHPIRVAFNDTINA
jgi:hypothetical protein